MWVSQFERRLRTARRLFLTHHVGDILGAEGVRSGCFLDRTRNRFGSILADQFQ